MDEKVRLGLLQNYKRTFKSTVIPLLCVVSSEMVIHLEVPIKVSPDLIVFGFSIITIVKVLVEGRQGRVRMRKAIEEVVVKHGITV